MNRSHIITYLILGSRLFLFALFQVLIYLIFLLGGSSNPWHKAEGWWTFSVIFTNIISILIIISLFGKDRKQYFKVFGFTREGWWKDLIIALVAFVILIPIAYLPNQFLAELLWGTTETSYHLFFRPLPLWAALFSLLFPITIAFAELPTYFGLVMPRLEKQLGNGWLAWAICSFFLALQHIALPLIFDGRFVIWRLGMFLPFAFFVGLCLKLRPRLFPYFMIGHAIIDLTVVIMIINL